MHIKVVFIHMKVRKSVICGNIDKPGAHYESESVKQQKVYSHVFLLWTLKITKPKKQRLLISGK